MVVTCILWCYDSISPPRPIHEAKLLALSTGLVVWASHVYYLASCPVGLPVFPSSFVDPPSAARTRPTTGASDADCELRFGSWTLDSDYRHQRTRISGP